MDFCHWNKYIPIMV
ncbi:MAG: hypothetical protein EZS28_029060, partial [Streblomastix strix]